MGLLFGSSSKKNRKIFDDALRQSDVRPVRKTVTCPQCRTRSTVTFLGPNDSYTCRNCGYRMYANEV